MSTQANITVFDGAATPVSHTLAPKDNCVLKDGTRMASWIEVNPVLPENAKIVMLVKQKTLPNGVVETTTEVYTPVMETASGQNASGYTAFPKVAFYDRDRHVKFVHPRSSVNSRRLNTQMLRNLLTNTTTSVTPVSAGFVDECSVQLAMPS